MKLSKEDLLAKISEKIIDEDIAIELLEDIADSFESDGINEEEIKAEYEAIISAKEEEIAELKKKYKERFLAGGSESEDSKPDETDETIDEIIDVKEI